MKKILYIYIYIYISCNAMQCNAICVNFTKAWKRSIWPVLVGLVLRDYSIDFQRFLHSCLICILEWKGVLAKSFSKALTTTSIPWIKKINFIIFHAKRSKKFSKSSNALPESTFSFWKSKFTRITWNNTGSQIVKNM